VPRSSRVRPAADDRRPRGYSTVETSIVMAIVGILASIGVAMADFGGMDLTVVQNEFKASLQEAFFLARAQGRPVMVALGDPKTPGIVPIRLPPKIKWGKPTFIPTPPGMADPKRADATGFAHARITVTPRRTATACAWFVNDGKEAVCMRLSGNGRIQVLRWKRRTGKWSLC